MKIIQLPYGPSFTRIVRLGAVPHRVFHLIGEYYFAMPRYDLLNSNTRSI